MVEPVAAEYYGATFMSERILGWFHLYRSLRVRVAVDLRRA